MIATVLEGGLKSVVGVVVVFLVLVTIHEFGHFIVAKKAGVLVPRFAIGFGPPLFRFQRGETEYSIRLFPIGGYVILAGDAPQDNLFRTGETVAVTLDGSGEVLAIGDPGDLPDGRTGKLVRIDTQRSFTVDLEEDGHSRTYRFGREAKLLTGSDALPIAPPDRQMANKPLWSRMLIVVAGPLMNVLLAATLFGVVAGIVGSPASPPELASIEPSSPAAQAGLQAGDVIEAVNGVPLANWMQFVVDVQGHPRAPLTLTILRDGSTFRKTVVPRLRRSGIGFIGVSPATTHDPLTAMESGIQQTGYYTQAIYNGIGMLFTHRNAFVKDAAGPVKIAAVIGEQAQHGIVDLMSLTAILSLNLAILNLLPIPALDGSRLLFMLVEAVRGKRLNPRTEYMVHAIGFTLIILLTVFRTYLDVTQLF